MRRCTSLEASALMWAVIGILEVAPCFVPVPFLSSPNGSEARRTPWWRTPWRRAPWTPWPPYAFPVPMLGLGMTFSLAVAVTMLGRPVGIKFMIVLVVSVTPAVFLVMPTLTLGEASHLVLMVVFLVVLFLEPVLVQSNPAVPLLELLAFLTPRLAGEWSRAPPCGTAPTPSSASRAAIGSWRPRSPV
ncbi:unnamed protein product [Prorocentrum cordatum]|uniref:Uncharacterized protein n=1 Tax=Prorocentrum cordatum TaxID=2364126 RepID=A0ABN9UCZ7_9DINO|nr:unnamed protein product [Polarella glacialis]